MVAGFCELDRGRILLGEQRIDTLPPHKRNTGMVFQNYAIFPNLTVGDNVAYGLRARKVRERQDPRPGGASAEAGATRLTTPSAGRINCPADSSSASRSPAHW